MTPDSYRSATPAGPQFTGPGYAGGDEVARALIDHGLDAWLQENGDAAINVSLGVSYAALTVATYGMASEAEVFAGMSARVASFGASSWRAITGVAGAVGEGGRRYGNQVTRWGAQAILSSAGVNCGRPRLPDLPGDRVSLSDPVSTAVRRRSSLVQSPLDVKC
ncbi:hypothetical protein [Sorangium sp. So ce233]|uniref:hypothetical protein n=1 Tax=Sorangium sp. So ce233 TaxID=3133290 RepID=UPI003F5FD83C